MSRTIKTHSGLYFDFEYPERHPYPIEEIAHALSRLCRYVGHVDTFYSVAQHSVIVSHLVHPDVALEGLLHDASEAYLGDVSSPLKSLLPDYRAIEQKVEKAIAQWHQLVYPMPAEVKGTDLQVLMTEKNCLFSKKLEGEEFHWPNIEEDPWLQRCGIKPVMPGRAKQMFLDRYSTIIQERKEC